MNNIKRITSFGLVAGMFLVAALATSSIGTTRTAFAQNISTAMNQTAAQMNQTAAQDMSNQTAAQMNQTASQMNQTAAESANKTSTNSAGNPTYSWPKIYLNDQEICLSYAIVGYNKLECRSSRRTCQSS